MRNGPCLRFRRLQYWAQAHGARRSQSNWHDCRAPQCCGAVILRTPLQLRFCNPWHIASDYTVEVTLGERRLWSVRLTGATVATPQPCADDGCPPAPSHPGRP